MRAGLSVPAAGHSWPRKRRPPPRGAVDMLSPCISWEACCPPQQETGPSLPAGLWALVYPQEMDKALAEAEVRSSGKVSLALVRSPHLQCLLVFRTVLFVRAAQTLPCTQTCLASTPSLEDSLQSVAPRVNCFLLCPCQTIKDRCQLSQRGKAGKHKPCSSFSRGNTGLPVAEV